MSTTGPEQPTDSTHEPRDAQSSARSGERTNGTTREPHDQHQQRVPMGVSGRIAAFFQDAQITPLIAALAFLAGLFAVMVTPREEEPQIDVTMANVIVPFPGAAARDVEQMVALPAEQVFSRMAGVEHVMSVSRQGIAVVTVQFEVGVPRTEALVRLYDTVQSSQDWLPSGLGALPPIVKPKGIDDVPIVTLTLYATDPRQGAFELERVAHAIEAEIKRVDGTREVRTYGGPGRGIVVELDPQRMRSANVTALEIEQQLKAANFGLPLGETVAANRALQIEAGPFLGDAQAVRELIVGARDAKPVFLGDVAVVYDGAMPQESFVWHGVAGDMPREHAAVTIAVTKKPGANAVDVAADLERRVAELRNTVIPASVEVITTRNYGETADAKAKKLIQKLMFATASVVLLVLLALGWREAAIVGLAVVLTLAATLFASWAWGFTLNRVSLFALIFSIGILVDDAIVVVENIHRHRALRPDAPLLAIIPRAVDEVGGPTILATLTVIAALLPMAFVTGLMGPYMGPIPINASMGMLISLAIAFVVTPWLANKWIGGHAHHGESRLQRALERGFGGAFGPFLDPRRGGRRRVALALVVLILIAGAAALPLMQKVILKMLPFDNKSELQLVVDMPAGTPPERTGVVLRELGAHLARVAEVRHYQAYVGLGSPINFNGLVRQYDLRAGGEVGDIQVTLAPKEERDAQSHEIATRLRPELRAIAERHGARLKVVEVPPGPPVLSPLVAEVYGPSAEGRQSLARDIEKVFQRTAGVVDIDTSLVADAPRALIRIDQRKAALAGVSQQTIVSTLRTALAGAEATYLHDASKYPVGVYLRLPVADRSDLEAALALGVRNAGGNLIPIREMVSVQTDRRDQIIHRKDLLPVTYVVGDMAGRIDSPLYAMFTMRSALSELVAPDGNPLDEYFVSQPSDPYRGYALKWDGEWQITYETFRDMGIAYGVGLLMIYLLVVAQFGSYLVPLIIMAPIPLTIIGVMPGHALLGAPFTATSMIGMIALAGIIVRNSILLVDFIQLQIAEGVPFRDAIVRSAVTRAQPIALTAIAAMAGAFFILDDPIFNGLAISLIFGIFVSTALTLVVIPLVFYAAYRRRYEAEQRTTDSGVSPDTLASPQDPGPS